MRFKYERKDPCMYIENDLTKGIFSLLGQRKNEKAGKLMYNLSRNIRSLPLLRDNMLRFRSFLSLSSN